MSLVVVEGTLYRPPIQESLIRYVKSRRKYTYQKSVKLKCLGNFKRWKNDTDNRPAPSRLK